MTEVLWSSPEGRDYLEFLKRVRDHYKKLDILGVKYGAESEPVTLTTDYKAEEQVYVIVAETGEPGLELYYTLDGNLPDTNSRRYSKPFIIKQKCDLKIQAF